MRFREARLGLQEKLREIMKIVEELGTCETLESCMDLVRDIARRISGDGDKCLEMAMIFYSLAKRSLGKDSFIVIFKPHSTPDIIHHASIVRFENDGLLFIDPKYRIAMNFKGLAEFEEKVGKIISFFNEEKALIRDDGQTSI